MSEIIPVFLGADLNCYNFARAFHEAYGVESYAYGRYPMAPTKYSKIVHFTTVPDMDNEDTMLRILHEFAAQHTGKKLYLFGCTDDYAAMILRDNRGAGFVIDPFGCCLSFDRDMAAHLAARKAEKFPGR